MNEYQMAALKALDQEGKEMPDFDLTALMGQLHQKKYGAAAPLPSLDNRRRLLTGLQKQHLAYSRGVYVETKDSASLIRFWGITDIGKAVLKGFEQRRGHENRSRD